MVGILPGGEVAAILEQKKSPSDLEGDFYR
jgi:hypothetical protein